MEYILVSQLKLVFLKLTNSDDEILTVVIVSMLLLLSLSKFLSFIFLPNIILSIMYYFFVYIFVFQRGFFKSARSWSSL